MIGRLSSGARIGFVLAAVTLAAGLTGCESGDFVSPPPSPRAAGGGAGGATAGTSAAADPFVTGSTVRNIEMIVARGQDPDEAEIERSTARQQAGYGKAHINVTPDQDVTSGDASARGDKPQAELVREAVARKPQALIIEPEDTADAELARAVGEALAAKVPVVLLGRPIAGVEKKPGSAPMTVVGPPSFANSARKLVELSIRNARNAKLEPDGGAILLVAPASDRFLNERIAAVREALKAAKIAAVDELLIPRQSEAGAEVLKKRLQADPKPSLVFTLDYTGTTASNAVATDIAEKRPFIQAGYTSNESLGKMAQAGEFAAVAEFVPTRLVQRAVSVAVAAAQGRNPKEKEEVALTVWESPQGSGVAHLQAKQKAYHEEKAARDRP
jgi:Periplasmic binding protein domain